MDTNNEYLDLECPSCGHMLKITFSDIGSQISCEQCKAPLDLDLGLGAAIADAGDRMTEMFGKMF